MRLRASPPQRRLISAACAAAAGDISRADGGFSTDAMLGAVDARFADTLPWRLAVPIFFVCYIKIY